MEENKERFDSRKEKKRRKTASPFRFSSPLFFVFLFVFLCFCFLCSSPLSIPISFLVAQNLRVYAFECNHALARHCSQKMCKFNGGTGATCHMMIACLRNSCNAEINPLFFLFVGGWSPQEFLACLFLITLWPFQRSWGHENDWCWESSWIL